MEAEFFLKKLTWYEIAFVLFVATLSLTLLWNPQFAPTDDFVFIDTLQKGKFLLYYSESFPYYDSIQLGRFTPLVAMEYNVFGLFSGSPNPFWYFLFHAVQTIVFAVVLVKLIKKLTSNKPLVFGAVALLMLSPGYVITASRLQLNERNLVFFMGLFALLYFAYLKDKKNWQAAALAITGNIIIYYKETAFIAIGAFAFARLLLFWKDSDKKTRILDALLFASALLYLIIYFLFVYLQGDLLYLGTSSPSLLDYAKRLINYAFFTDALIYLILLPIFSIRLYEVFIKKEGATPLMDPLIAGATAFSVVYIFISYGPYYLLPAYAFAIPAIILYFKEKDCINRFFKINFAIVIATIILNILPSGLHYLTYHKYLMWNFNSTLDFLVKEIGAGGKKGRADIFLYGVDRDSGRGVYGILGDFLRYKGLGTYQYDLKSDIEAPDGDLWVGKTIPSFTVFNDRKAHGIESGDYLIIPPQSKILITAQVLEMIENDYDLVFKTESLFLFPHINAKSGLKYLVVGNGLVSETIIENTNAFATPNYYVFVRK